MYSYPPPYWYQSSWYYATPWLFLDGNKDPGYSYSGWETYILNRLAVPSQLQIDMYAEYSTQTNAGFVDIWVYNEGADTLVRKLVCVLTESGIYYSAPNGLQWHDHVCRDMIPDQNGTQITLYPGDTTYVHLDFTFDPTWVAANCEVLCLVQHDSLTADSIKDIMQGGKTSLVANAVEEQPISLPREFKFSVCYTNGISVEYALPFASRVKYEIVDLSGRILQTRSLGVQNAGQNYLRINRSEINCSSGAAFLIMKIDDTEYTEKLIFF